MGEFGKLLILFGVILVAVGAVLTFAGKIPWIGRLPGDIYYKNEHITFYFPLVTCLLVSAVLSLLLFIFRR